MYGRGAGAAPKGRNRTPFGLRCVDELAVQFQVHKTCAGKVVNERHTPRGFSVSLATKDLRLALAAAEKARWRRIGKPLAETVLTAAVFTTGAMRMNFKAGDIGCVKRNFGYYITPDVSLSARIRRPR